MRIQNKSEIETVQPGGAMHRTKNYFPRGASSALPMVIVVVLFLLVALGIWMWVDMNKHDLSTKVQQIERLKKGAQPGETIDVEAPPQAATVFICHRAAAPITIDGSPDDPAWRDAQVIDNF